ncbi:MAG: hypothetical protein SVK08_02330 [Halobacteriota archaeon]|nr:hypothetical protein [Halobacteriota archaeon]
MKKVDLIYTLPLITGFLIMLPLGKLLLPLILFFPGLSVYIFVRDEVSIVELLGASITLSILIIPVMTVLSHLTMAPTSILLGVQVIVFSTLSLKKRVVASGGKEEQRTIIIAIVVALCTLIPLLSTFTIGEGGLITNPTHSGDLNYHLSIINRYITSAQIPPEDPYLPGHSMPYHFFMHIFMGETCKMTSINPFTLLKVVFPLLASALFLNIYTLTEYIFNRKAAIASSLLYLFAGGFSWVYLLWLHFSGGDIYLFRVLIYSWSPDMLKYDPTLLFYLLPQTQSFALVIMVFAIYLLIYSMIECSDRMAILAGFTLGILSHYHLISAFPIFLLVGCFTLYKIREKGVFKRSTIILGIAIMITSFQIFSLSSGAGSQISIDHHPGILFTSIVSMGVLIPFSVIGAVKSFEMTKARGILIFSVILIIILNFLTMPLTQNTYRFLVYLAIPISIFSGYFVSLYWDHSSRARILITICIVLMIPSTVILGTYYLEARYVHADDYELLALDWISQNTQEDDIFFEEPYMFPRIPLVTGRRVAYAGPLYMEQYHGVREGQRYMNTLSETDSSVLNSEFHMMNVSYVFVGHRESKYLFTDALSDEMMFDKVYDKYGIRIYRVI